MRYRVSRRASFMHKGNILPSGEIVPEVVQQELTQAQLDDHVRAGFLVPVGKESTDFGVDPQTKESKATVDLTKAEDLKELRIATPDKRHQVAGKWKYNPASLKGKKLEELQVMVAEIDHTVASPLSIDLAIAMLSADFRG